jgi:hypothetical protein
VALLPSTRHRAGIRLIALISSLFAFVAMGSSGVAATGLSQGSAAIPRAYLDLAANQVYIYGGGTFDANTRVSTITWYVQAGGNGRRLTPILFEKTSPNVFAIRGVGTPRVSVPGLNAAPFELVYGSDVITNGNFTWGWVNSSVAAGGVQSNSTAGAVDFDYSLGGAGVGGAGTTNTWYFTPSNFGPGPILSLGYTFGIGGGGTGVLDAAETRAYSASMTVVPNVAPTLSVTPASVELWATAGAVSPYNVPVPVSSSGVFTASADQPWINLSAASGTGATTINVGANAASLAPGTYAGTVTFAAADVSAARVNVTLHVANLQAALQESSSTLAIDTPLAIASADFNHDGRADFAVAGTWSANATPRVEIFTSDAAGGFSKQVIATPEAGRLVTADFNGDGWDDLAATAWGPHSVEILMNDGTGTFTHTSVAIGDTLQSADLAIGDIDGDGRPDIAVATFFGPSLIWLRGTGTGFAEPAVVGACLQAQDVTVGDYNGDGRADVAGRCEGDHVLRVYLGDGAGGFTEATASSQPATGVSGLRTADLDGDGRQDILAGGAYTTAKIYFGDATAGIRAGTQMLPAQPGIIGDVDGDGYPDLVFRSSGSVILYTGGPGGTFTDRGRLGVTFDVGDLVVADFDGDGANDIVGTAGGDNVVKALTAGAAETTSALVAPASAVFAHPFSLTLTVTAGGAHGAITPQGTGQLFLCDASFVCDTPASTAVAGSGTFVLPVTIPLAHAYHYFVARFEPTNGLTLASATNPVGLAVAVSPSTLTLNPPVSQPLGGTPFEMRATIAPSQATGSVKFYDAAHGTLLATGSIVDGVATATLPGLTAHFFYTIQATYDGDANVSASASDYVDFQVGAAPTISLAGLTREWSGVPEPVQVNKPADLPVIVTYNGSQTPPVDLGDYTVEARSTDPARPAVATGTLHITPNHNVTIDVPALTVIYDGEPHSTTATTNPAGLNVVVQYRNADTNAVIDTPPVEPGVYFEVVDVDDPRGVQLTQGVGVITIEKQTATVTLGNLTQTFGGSNTGPSVETNPADLNVVITYNGLPNPQGLGTYTVVATIHDPHWQGGATGTYVLVPAPFTIGNTDQTFDGTPKAVTVTPNVPGTTYTVTYGGSSTPPVNAGAYLVVVTSTDPAHPGAVTDQLTIRKGIGTFTVSSTSQAYTGAPRAVTVTTSPVGLEYTVTYNGGAAPPVNAGAYPFTVTLTDANVTAVAPQSGTLTITKATASVTIDNLSQGDTGQAHPVTVTTTPTGLAVSVTYNGGTTPPTTAGNYTVVATVNDANYTGSATAILAVVPRAVTTISAQYNSAFLPRSGPGVQNPTIEYGAATVTINVSGGVQPITGRIAVLESFNNGPLTTLYDSLTAATPPVSFTVTLPIGMHQVIVGYQGDELHQPANLTTVFDIVRATANFTPDFQALTQTFNGQPRSVAFTVFPLGTNFTVTYDGSTTPPTDAGTYRVVAKTADPNVRQTSVSYTLTINKMAATVILGDLTQVADGNPKSPTATSTPPLPPGYAMQFTFDGKKNPPSKIGTYAVVASNPNITGTATGTFTLLAPMTVAGGTFTYDGTPKAATVTFLDPITRIKSVVYANATYNSQTPPTDAGTYTVTVTGCGGGNACHNEATATLVINKAQVGLGFGMLTNATTGNPVPVTVNWSPSSVLNVPLTVTYNGSTTVPTSAGSYAVVARVDSPNITAQSISATYFIVPGATQMTLQSRVVTWNGAPQSLTATISPSNAPYTLTYEKAGRLPGTTAPSEAGLYTVKMTATGGYSGQATATLDIQGVLSLGAYDSGRPFTFTVDGAKYPADTARVVSSEPHVVVAEGKQKGALERYTFDHWLVDSGVSLNGGLPTTMPSSVTSLGFGRLTAVAKSEFAVITDVVEGTGTVTGDGWYSGTTRVALTATPAPGFLFERFVIDGQDITENGYMLSMANAGHRVRAHFVPASSLTVRSEPAVGGTVLGAGIYPVNSKQTVTAAARPGFRFAGWQVTGGNVVGGKLADYTSPAEVKLTSTRVVVTAMFEPIVAIDFEYAHWSPGLLWVDIKLTNTSSVTVNGLQLTDLTDTSKLIVSADPLPLEIGTLAPGQSATYRIYWILLSDLPPSSFSFTATVRSAEGYVYTKATKVSNY